MKIELEKQSGGGQLSRAENYRLKIKALVWEKMNEFGLSEYIHDFEAITKSEGIGSPKLFKKYGKILNIIKDFYFEYS